MSKQEQELRVLRDQIDSIDQQIHQLLNDRARCAQQVAEVKQKYQGEQSAVFYRPEREAQVLMKVMERNQGPLADKEVARLFREVMSVCLALEQPMQIAYLGPQGSFIQQAAFKHFGQSAITVATPNLEEVFRAVETGQVNYGVVPIESVNEGVVSHTLDLFRQYPLSICGEVEMVIHHHLLQKAALALEQITTLYATHQALAHCREWLSRHLPNVHQVPVADNQEAARLASEAADAAALGCQSSADLFSLQISHSNVEDRAEGCSRYLVIGSQQVGPSGQDKTSILVVAHDEPGALYEMLEPFRNQQISLTRMEARSDGGESLFYLDFEGHQETPEIDQLLRELEAGSVELKRLGSYPKAVL